MTLNTSWPADDEEFLSWLNSHFVDILRAWQDNEPTEFNQPELIGRIYQLARSKRLFFSGGGSDPIIAKLNDYAEAHQLPALSYR